MERWWKQHFNKTTASFGPKPTVSDDAVCVVKYERGLIIIHLQIDDSLVFWDDKAFLQDFKTFIHAAYKLE